MTKVARRDWVAEVTQVFNTIGTDQGQFALAGLAGPSVTHALKRLDRDPEGCTSRHADANKRLSSNAEALEFFEAKVVEEITPKIKAKKARGNEKLSFEELRCYVNRAIKGVYRPLNCKRQSCMLGRSERVDGTHRAEASEAEAAEDPDGFLAFDAMIERNSLRQVLAALFKEARITAEERQIFVWVNFEERTIQEASELWDVPSSTLTSRHDRLLKKLRKAAQELEIDL